MEGLLPLVFTMLATGLVAGVIAGLLGVGGGIVIVPVLDTALAVRGVDPAIRMHIAVGTSLATIIFTSISSARAHHARGAVDMDLARLWGPFIFVGSMMGSVVAAAVDSAVLAAIFGVVALLIAIQMLLPLEDYRPWKSVPRGPGGIIAPSLIGGLSSMMGIGGGTFSVAILTMMSQPIHRAVGTAAFFGLLIAIPGTLGFIVNGWGDPRLPVGNLGYVNLIGVALIAPMTVMMAPLGARLAHKLSKRHLSLAFGVFLGIVSVRMILRATGVLG
ncbi:sulfite exporter TauE/SafE family protein [Pseudohalioglobus sediminis]|uniref:Probable membrane transporter protein n=1 Tax=Pseudohalioglobus sediminis TaxID=2606449 RepID=A0A5B0X7M2_9GAMM|nr:sulfite exporter TauE/SafE family protein [Pseudohalioglobus sediminis]KAA1194598.1 sulfite exporter TauE/SafE family protein [Pseudohalioglobus sediminis]